MQAAAVSMLPSCRTVETTILGGTDGQSRSLNFFRGIDQGHNPEEHIVRGFADHRAKVIEVELELARIDRVPG